MGTALGVAVAWSITSSNGDGLKLGISVVLLGIGVSLLASVAAAAYPAIHASRQDPAAILREL